jgi:DNA-binding transcriptional LysR family regulator
MKPLDADSLAFLHTLATEASFSAASARLGVTRSALSHRLRGIETRVGVSLFHRAARRLVVTDAGEAVLGYAQRVAEQVDEANIALQSSIGSVSGHLRITAPTAFGRAWLIPRINSFAGKYPDISLEIILTDQRVDLVEEKFDLALRVAATLPNDLVAYPLRKIRWVLCASREYLKRHGTPARLEDLAKHRYLSFGRTGGPASENLRAKAGAKAAEVALRPCLRSNDQDTLVSAVEAGLGISLFPDYVIEHRLKGATLQMVLEKLAFETPFGSTAYALFARHRILPARIRAFLEHVKNEK